MSGKRILQSAVDAAMAVLLPLLMAYSLIGEEIHEWLGTAMLLLFLLHHALNWRWYGSLFRGRYSPVRILNTAVDFLLLADMLAMGISGIVMSSHVFQFLNISNGASAARAVHLPGAFWGFLLMSFHIGLHWQTVLSRIRAVRPGWPGGKAGTVMRLSVILVSAYGIFAFFKRRFPDYLFLRSSFMFFNFDEPAVFYVLDMAAVMVAFAALGFCCTRLLADAERRRRKDGPQ